MSQLDSYSYVGMFYTVISKVETATGCYRVTRKDKTVLKVWQRVTRICYIASGTRYTVTGIGKTVNAAYLDSYWNMLRWNVALC